MRLPDIVDVGRAVCITVPARWPEGFASVQEQFARRGVPMTALVNGPAEALPAAGPGMALMPHEGEAPPPATFWGPAGSWWHRQAFMRIVQEALDDGVEKLLIAEDDCVFTEDADAILGRVELPEDWAMAYLGAMHAWGKMEPAGPYLMRTCGARGIHAVVYRREAFETLLGLPPEGPIDHEIAERLHPSLPCYALWPNAVIQAEVISTLTGKPSARAAFFDRS